MLEGLDQFQEENNKNKQSFKEIIGKYLAYWPYFAVSLTICIGAAIFFIRYATPQYTISTLIVIKSQSPSDKSSDLLEAALTAKLKPDFNIAYEQQQIQSQSLLAKVVEKAGFNTSYYLKGKIRSTNIYRDAPFRLIPQNIDDSTYPFSFTLKGLTNKGGDLYLGSAKNSKKYSFKWNVPFDKESNSFTLTPKTVKFDSAAEYLVVWRPTTAVVTLVKQNLVAAPYEKNASIFQLSLLDENLKEGKDILDALVREYNLQDIEERNVISSNTIKFIDDRLSIVSNELNGVEGNLEEFRGRNRGVDLEAQSSVSFGNSNNTSQTLSTISVQQGVVNMIREYFSNPNTADKLVPSTMGLDDATLSSLIGKYNDLQLTKQREAPLVSPNSTVMQDINNQIIGVRGNILEALDNISKNLKYHESTLAQENGEYNRFLTSLPRKERMMQEIKRKQSITEGLYLYLLQKREEAAISSASSNISNYKQIAPADGWGPIEPNVKNILLIAAMLALLVPGAWIAGKEMLNDSILSRRDISKRTSIPILTDIDHLKTSKSSDVEDLPVFTRGIIGEQFRMLRTNLELITETATNQKTFLVTSALSGEGKSFVSLNIATALAIPGRKVALLEFDLRRPSLSKNLGIKKEKGITSFLDGTCNNIDSLYHCFDKINTLHIFPTGPVSQNPGDILLSRRIDLLFEQLVERYEYIVIDTAPTSLVSDAFILNKYANAVLFIIRQKVTKQKQLGYLQDIVDERKLSNVGVIFNDIKKGGKYGYYGYDTLKDY